MLTTVVFLLLLALPAAAQISPGPLSKPHRDLDGPTACMRCHAASTGSPTFRCLDCHDDIALRLRQKRGLHPALMNPGAGSAACVRCHSEHNGENFSLVRWDPSPGKFDHSQTGFLLDGKHAALACNRCHNPQKIVASERGLIAMKDLSRTFLGLSPSCTSCHEDKHRGQLSATCQQCHNAFDWKVARSFDHSKTRYPLTGAHRQLACEKCHTAKQDGVLKYTGLKFDRCSSCHNDVHRGAFQQTCETCHTTARWKQTTFAARFDHSKTKYPLTGQHLELSCTTCHRGGDFKTAIAHQRCADCHRPDPHSGQFAARMDAGACESCHTVAGFKPATFGLAEHNATGYPLREKHAVLACAKCHVPAGRATLYKLKFALCLDCHKDPHLNQFADTGNRCQQCHTETSFRPATITLIKHQSFPLTGSHLAVACIDCHKPVAGTRAVAYHFNNLSCTTCHNDPHRGEFALRVSKASPDGKPLGCTACHSTKVWQDLQAFDHAAIGFPLSGAHRAVPCADCHRPPNLERTLRNVNFKAAPQKCEQCHEDAHAAQFAVGGVTTCQGCHNSTQWRPALFDHEKTVFPLRGGHQNVRCAACHVNRKAANGKAVLFYKPTPTKCSACHGNTLAGPAALPAHSMVNRTDLMNDAASTAYAAPFSGALYAALAAEAAQRKAMTPDGR